MTDERHKMSESDDDDVNEYKYSLRNFSVTTLRYK